MTEGHSTILEWAITNVTKPGRLATVLVIVGLAMFMGFLPSPMLSAIAQVTEEHQGIQHVLRQICVNTAKDQAAVNGCYFEQRPK